MLNIYNSKLRRKLLGYCFAHSDEEWYVREIAVIIEENHGNLSREIKNFEKEGLFNSYKKGNLKIFKLNKNYLLYPELKKILLKTEGIEGSLKEIILKHKKIKIAFIYGSYAKGKENKNSDVDLIIVGTIVQKKFVTDIKKIENKLNREINFTCYDSDEFEEKAKKEGSFLNIILKDHLIILKGNLYGK